MNKTQPSNTFTNSELVEVEIPTPPGQEMSDPRPNFTKAVEIAGVVIGQVTEGNLRQPSPCGDFDAGDMAAHMVGVMQRVSAVAKGLDPLSVPMVVEGLEPDGFVDAWDLAVQEQLAVWSDNAALGQLMVLPFAKLSGAIALSLYLSEILTHTWDLAKALDVDVDWDKDAVEAAILTMQFGLPAEPRGGEIPFGPVVDVAADAPAIDRLVGWLGRQP